ARKSSISLGESGFPLAGMRASGSLEVMRLNSSLASLLPGTTTLALRIASRVSSASEPFFLPLVWHSAHRALINGTISCAKSTGRGSSAHAAAARSKGVTSARRLYGLIELTLRQVNGRWWDITNLPRFVAGWKSRRQRFPPVVG